MLVLLLAAVPAMAGLWTVYVANTTCVDSTWVLNEADTKKAVAELVRAHLDEMNRTDALPEDSRDRYNMMVLQEAEFFLERYPERGGELLRRVKEGRVYVSPFLNNTLWGFQSTEGAIRSFLPARRFERKWGVPFDTAAHIELPSMPWGVASILAGGGFRWLAVPYYDSTRASLNSRSRRCSGGKAGRSQDQGGARPLGFAARLLCAGRSVSEGPAGEEGAGWIDHYAALGAIYPLRSVLANGTHSDLSFQSRDQVAGFARAIEGANHDAPGVRVVNASFGQFFREVDAAEAKSPFLPAVRGSFGHSWELWPVFARQVRGLMRTAERHYLAAESLLAIAGASHPQAFAETRAMRERAERDWAMLADHAWNGSDAANKLENLRLRKAWSEEFDAIAEKLEQEAWSRAGIDSRQTGYTVFNPLSFARRELVSLDAPGARFARSGWRTAARGSTS